MQTLKAISKTNYTFLKEILKGNEEGLEFLEAIKKEHISKVAELRNVQKELNKKVEELQSDIEMGEYAEMCDTEIDFGIGTLHFKQPDNLKIQQVMEKLASEYQVNSNHTSLF